MKKLIIAAIIIFSAVCASAKAESQNILRLDKSNDEALNAIISKYAQKFQLKTFSDDVTGLNLTYNLYLPENYSPEKKYPVVFFIADASSAGKNPEYSLTQCYGALVGCEDECIVIVPTYPVVVLDDHEGFVVSDYVELTGRFMRRAVKNYAVDDERVYATGQSMGCMTLLILAAEYPDLFTACLFVSGQWDITKLEKLTEEKFIYITSAGDEKASAGQNEVINMFNAEEIPYVSYKNIDAKNPAVVIPHEQQANFITFKAKTTLPEDTKGNYSEHMTSFDYAYKISALREWLLAQRK